MRTYLIWAFALFSISGCASVNIEPEMKILSESVSDVEKDLNKNLKTQSEADLRARTRFNSQNNVLVALSPECRELGMASGDIALSSCRITETLPGGVTAPVYPSEALKRKISGLKAYVDTLVLLSSSDSEEAIVAAVAELEKASGSLAKTTEADGLVSFAKTLSDQKDTIAGTTRFAVSNLRRRKLHSIATEYDPDVQQVIKETRAILFKNNVDPEYQRLYTALSQAETRMKEATLSGNPSQIETATYNLRSAYAKFVKYAPKSIYVKVSSIGQAHHALVNRLKANPSQEEVLEFLKSIKAVADTL